MSVFDDFNGLGPHGAECAVASCPAGKIGGWNYQFKDGPCAADGCGWPVGVRTRPHFTDTPARPIVDAGKEALVWLKGKK